MKGFYSHAIAYVLVNAVLFHHQPGDTGAMVVLLGAPVLGIGLGVHALNVFVFSGLFGQDWEERKTRRLMDQERER